MRLDTDSQKLRLLAEFSAVQQFNLGREEPYRIKLSREGTTIRGEISMKPTVNQYRLRFTLGDDYPASPPTIEIVEPSLPAGVPHLLGGNRPCLFRESGYSDSRWNPSRHTVVFALLCSWRWLLCLDLWATTGRWVIPDAQAESSDQDQSYW